MKKTKKGFTLVELIVAIAIFSILATVAIVGYTSFLNDAKNTKAEMELRPIVTYINAELADDGKWEYGTDSPLTKDNISTETLQAALNTVDAFKTLSTKVSVSKNEGVITITYTTSENITATATLN